MDERLKLTERQRELADKFNLLCREMKAENIGFIKNDTDLLLINLKNVEDWVDADEMVYDVENNIESHDEELVSFEEMFLSHLVFFYTSGVWDDNMGIRFKK